jgi:hypothetical protein
VSAKIRPPDSLLNAVQSLADLAYELHDPSSEHLALDLAEQIPGSAINVVIAGQFKRGKSSLINAFLRCDLLPTGALPLTGVTTAIRYGECLLIEVRMHGEPQARRIAPADLALFVTEKFNARNALGVERVDVYFPADILRGISLFDTPGVGSVYEHNTATALATLPRADAAILVVGPEPPISLEELEYARKVLASSEKLFVVVNKSDLAGDALDEVLDFTRIQLRQTVSCETDVLSVSATKARTAQIAESEDPEFTRLEAALRSFVAQSWPQTRLVSLRRRSLRIVERLDVVASLRLSMLNMPTEERLHRRDALEQSLQLLDDRSRLLELAMNDDVRQLRAELDESLDGLYGFALPAFRANAEGMAALPRDAREGAFGKMLEAILNEWRQETRALADAALRISADTYARMAYEIEASMWKAGLEAASLDASSLVLDDVHFEPPNLELITSFVPTTALELLAGAVIGALPPVLRMPLLRRRYERLLEQELDAAKGKFRHGIANELELWRRCTRDAIRSSLRTAREIVLSAFEQPTTDRPDDEAVRRMETVRCKLETLREWIGTFDISIAEAAP